VRRKVLLVEPNYKNKYPPMGLMKLATYYKRLGDDVRFYKGDLLDLSAALVFDDLLAVLSSIRSDVFWRQWTPQLIKYIRRGLTADIPGEPAFKNEMVREELRLYRQKFKNQDYFNDPHFDVVGITTLFTFHWDIAIETINFVKRLCKNQDKVFIGGIASSIIPGEIKKETGIYPIIGILSKPGVLDKGNDIIIDTLPLDYSILEEIDYNYPTTDAYYGYMTRGCPNRCDFCAVPRLEPKFVKYISIKKQLKETKKAFGAQKDLLLLDNNVLFSPCFDMIIDEIKACGFAKGATYLSPNQYIIAVRNLRKGTNNRAFIRKCVSLYRELLEKCRMSKLPGAEKDYFDLYERIIEAKCYEFHTASKKTIIGLHTFVSPLYEKYVYHPCKRQRYVDFNQGVDARQIVKHPERITKLAEIAIRPLRIAFDDWAFRETYQKAVEIAIEAGIRNLSNYMLYNSNEENDTPVNLYRRLRLNVDLCHNRHLVSIFSFPMKYHPIDDPVYFRNRDFIGKSWNRKYIRAVQAVLNATHGKIGRGKDFFEAAFGKNEEEFFDIMMMPEALIINRYFYRDNGVTTVWREKLKNLNKLQRAKADTIIHANDFSDGSIAAVHSPSLRDVLEYYKIKRER
jgi:hypothetical protein